MSRHIEPGDKIIDLNTNKVSIIQKIEPDRIITDGGSININEIESQNLEFLASDFTGDYLIDLKFIENLSPEELDNICSGSKYLSQICRWVWINKFTNEFGSDSLKFKPKEFSYLTWYQMLNYPEKTLDWAIKQNNFDMVKWIVTHLNSETEFEDSINLAVKLGNLEMLKFLEELGYLPDDRVANEAALNEDWDILAWLDEKEIYPNEQAWVDALENNQSEVLDWLEYRGITAPIYD